MKLTRRQVDRLAARVFVALWVIALFGAVYGIYPFVQGRFTSADDIEVSDPAQAVRDARALIADRNANPGKYGPFTEPEALPPSLRLRKLRYAKVHTDHLDLVLARNPDWSKGARIWSTKHRPHRDKATRYPEIYFFRYTNDAPASLDNIP